MIRKIFFLISIFSFSFAGENASWMTGESVNIDGGSLAGR